ncbi:uncharacterized protein [Epargyreus clarus]|uniref:uncharacterized protein n=1 Tax=Epargyreus clarus TaxID=520877 RepID=UPI003C3055C2
MIFFIFIIFAVNAAINPYGPGVVNDFTGCINNLIETNFNEPGLLIFGHTQNTTPLVVNIRAQILNKIHKSLNYSVEIKTPADKVEICYSNPEDDNRVLHRDLYEAIKVADYFVIIVDTYEEFNHLASKIIRSRIWNPEAKFIIALLNLSYNGNENVEYVERILSCLFRYNVVNVVVVIPQAGRIRNALIYSWSPYDPPKFCGYSNETANNRLILENTCRGGIVKNCKLLFYDKVPIDMMKCVINVLALEKQPFASKKEDHPNIEMYFINTMLSRFNFTIYYKLLYEFRGERRNNREWDGALKKLVAKEGNVLLGGIYPDYDVHEDFEYSYSYFRDAYTWVVPLANPYPPWKALTIIFRTFLWYSIAAGFVVCVISWKVLGFMSDDSLYNKSIVHCFLNTCIVSLGFCAYIRPVKQSLRVFFVFLNLYCTILITGYQTKLIQVLQNPARGNQIDTIEELVSSGLKFGGSEELHDLFSNSNDSLDKIINDNWIDVDKTSDALIDVAVHRNFSIICSRLELAYLSATMPELTDHHGILLYYTFDIDTFTVPIEMLALRGFPFMKKFSRILKYYRQIGMNEVLTRYYEAFNMRQRTKTLLALNVHTYKFSPLMMLHLQGGFLVLFLGMVSGFVVFIIEIVINCKYVKGYLAKYKIN